MPKFITNLGWGAADVPSGLLFSEIDGSFSGSPHVEAGEYIVPVSVKTNYGSDAKNIRIVVDDAAHSVYALGNMAKSWSNNAEPDAYGFRKINIPNASKLNSIPAGFAAKCVGGQWFIGSSSSFHIYGGNGYNYGNVYNVPAAFDVTNVLDIKGGRMNSSIYFAYMTPDDTTLMGYTKSSNGYSRNFTISLNNIKMLHKDLAYGFSVVSQDNQIFTSVLNNTAFNYHTPAFTHEKYISKLISHINSDLSYFFIDSDGDLFEFSSSKGSGVPEKIFTGVSDVWLRFGGSQVWLLTSDGKLYARGSNISYVLGIPDNTQNFNDFVYIDNFEAKKIEYCFMLTHDGKLFHTGPAVSGITSLHNGWTHIFPEYRFQDFSYVPGDASALGTKTLTVILKEVL